MTVAQKTKFYTYLFSRTGSTALEFALILPVMIAVVFGILDFALVFFVDVLLENGVRQAARFGLTGQGDTLAAREDALIAIVVDSGFGFIEASRTFVTTRVFDTFADIGVGEPFADTSPFNGVYDLGESFSDLNGNGVWDGIPGTPGAGGPDQIVAYTVTTTWAPLTPFIEPFAGEDGTFALHAAIAIRNEPFNPFAE